MRKFGGLVVILCSCLMAPLHAKVTCTNGWNRAVLWGIIVADPGGVQHAYLNPGFTDCSEGPEACSFYKCNISASPDCFDFVDSVGESLDFLLARCHDGPTEFPPVIRRAQASGGKVTCADTWQTGTIVGQEGVGGNIPPQRIWLTMMDEGVVSDPSLAECAAHPEACHRYECDIPGHHEDCWDIFFAGCYNYRVSACSNNSPPITFDPIIRELELVDLNHCP